MQKLYTSVFGSYLYGTYTDKSDKDYKTVYLPALEDLVMGNSVKNIQQSTASSKNRNSVDDIDHEYIPLQVFLSDFVAGQSYALEIAFSCISKEHTSKEVFSVQFEALCWVLTDRYLTSNISALMGYINSQAIKYGVKGQRLEAAEQLYELLNGFNDFDKIANVKSAIDKLNNKYIFNTTYVDGSKENHAPCVSALEKIYPDTISVSEAKARTSALVKTYGHRAVKAKDMDGHDWKALSHAVRIGAEIIELLANNTLQLPLRKEDSDFIREIKEGKLSFETVHAKLAEQLDMIDELQKNCTLPTKNEIEDEFNYFKKLTLINFYGLENHCAL